MRTFIFLLIVLALTVVASGCSSHQELEPPKRYFMDQNQFIGVRFTPEAELSPGGRLVIKAGKVENRYTFSKSMCNLGTERNRMKMPAGKDDIYIEIFKSRFVDGDLVSTEFQRIPNSKKSVLEAANDIASKQDDNDMAVLVYLYPFEGEYQASCLTSRMGTYETDSDPANKK